MIKVLMVCMGNICRSPMAEAIFQHTVEQAALSHQIQVDSAGTHDYHVGEQAHPRTREQLHQHHIAYEGRSRLLTKADLTQFDYVLVMDEANMQFVKRMGVGNNVRYFLQAANTAGTVSRTDVPDPYYTGEYELVFDLVSKGSEAFLAEIRAKHGL